MVLESSSDATEPSEPQSKGEKTAERILDAAEDLFAERGYAGTTLRDVAARVGLQNPSLYNHFSSKQVLYAAVLERGLNPLLVAMSEAVTDGESADAERVVEAVMKLLAARPNLPRLVLHETLSGGESLTPMLTDWVGPVLVQGQEMLRANPGAGRWSEEQIPLLVLAMYHIVVGYFTTAPLYQRLSGEDLLAPRAIERQTDVLRALVSALFTDDQQGRLPES